MPLAAVCIAVCFITWKYSGRRKSIGRYRVHAALLFGVAGAALLVRVATLALWVTPIGAREGTEARIHAAVLETSRGYIEDTARATVLVDEVDGKTVRPFRVYFSTMPESEPGDCFTAEVRFTALEQNTYQNSYLADGVFLAAEYLSDYAPAGQSNALWARACRLRASAVGVLRRTLSQPYSGMAAAITVGDRTALKAEVQDTLRRAGLAHMIVVSGLHLSALSGLVYAVMRGLFGYRAGAVGAMASIPAFWVLIGFTPSAVRAGIAMLLFYGGMLLLRRSDGLTSLGAAALLLCLQNPYAALDTGLLLSFSATVGVLWVVAARRRWLAEHTAPQSLPVRVGMNLLWAAAVPVSTTLTTLPVLIINGSGVSLLGVVSNLLVVPVLPLAVGSGFATILFGLVPGFRFFARLAGLICSLTLRWALWVARFVANVPHTFIYVSGAFAFCCVILFCLLSWSAWAMRIPLRRAAVACVLFVVFCGAIYTAADTGVVRIVLAGSGANPAVVVLEGMKTAVIYRGPDSNLRAVQDVLAQYNRAGVDFLIDLHADEDADKLTETLGVREIVCVESDVVNHAVYAPFYDVLLYARRQAGGSLACIEVRGYRIGVASGSVELSALPALDVYIAGTGRPEGLSCENLILPRSGGYRWLEDAPPEAQIWKRASICVRAGASVMIREE